MYFVGLLEINKRRKKKHFKTNAFFKHFLCFLLLGMPFVSSNDVISIGEFSLELPYIFLSAFGSVIC
jgi:hypothetical protein